MSVVTEGRVRLAAVPLAILAVAASAGPAAASGSPPPQGVPAIEQYVEAFPTAGGPVSGAGAVRPGTSQSVPPALSKLIQAKGGKDVNALEGLAASARSGHAPTPATSPPGRGILAGLVDDNKTALVLLGLSLLASVAVALVLARRSKSAAPAS
ncbi:MAG: hypothetical protein ACYDCH_04395 [Gaiellaceae bacterium]